MSMEFPIDVLINTGALGIFVYYTLQNNRDWRTYLTERNSKLEKALDKLSAALDSHFKPDK